MVTITMEGRSLEEESSGIPLPPPVGVGEGLAWLVGGKEIPPETRHYEQ